MIFYFSMVDERISRGVVHRVDAEREQLFIWMGRDCRSLQHVMGQIGGEDFSCFFDSLD